jgi:hypothetical protein
MVVDVMGIPTSDELHASVRTLLDEHWDLAIQGGENDVAALQSTFITACASAPAASTF